MQTQEQAEAAAYSCVLGQAERRETELDGPRLERVPMICATCTHFRHLQPTEDRWAIVEALPEGFENRMNFARLVAERMGVCDLRFDDPGGMLYTEDFSGCDPDNGYEEENA